MFEAAQLQALERQGDLRVLDWRWITCPPRFMVLPRLLQVLALPAWPRGWQCQVEHLCRIRRLERPRWPVRPAAGLSRSGFSRSP